MHVKICFLNEFIKSYANNRVQRQRRRAEDLNTKKEIYKKISAEKEEWQGIDAKKDLGMRDTMSENISR